MYSELQSSEASAGSRWSEAATVSQRDGYSNQNAVLFAGNDSLLHLFHSQQGGGQGEKEATVWHLSAALGSDGRAAKFSAPRMPFPAPGTFDKNRVVPRLDGSWLLPLYDAADNTPFNAFLSTHADPDEPSAWRIERNCERSHSHTLTHPHVLALALWAQFAHTWIRHGAFSTSHSPAPVCICVRTDNDCVRRVQPSVVRPTPGSPTLLAFFRDRDAKSIYWARSPDDGESWSKCEATPLPNSNAGIEAWTMRSGRIAMVYNPLTRGRDPLAISLSDDGGATWPHSRVLEQADGKQEFSYPTLREDVKVDGLIHVSYTWKRQTIKHSIVTEAWVMQHDHA